MSREYVIMTQFQLNWGCCCVSVKALTGAQTHKKGSKYQKFVSFCVGLETFYHIAGQNFCIKT